jgi:hypothetical protein
MTNPNISNDNCRRFWETNPSTEQTAQLTIFYAGTVNVFDDVTAEKVSKKSKLSLL